TSVTRPGRTVYLLGPPVPWTAGSSHRSGCEVLSTSAIKRLTQRKAVDRSQTPAAVSFHGEFIVVDRSRLVDGGREIFSKRLFERPEQRSRSAT
ncbi:MAG: hypothetical protein WBZ51_20160, partial [Xanthobacteraceae bacterium]